MLYPYNGILFDHKRNGVPILPFSGERENIMLNEQSQTKRDSDTKRATDCMASFTKCPEQAQKWRVGSGC